jgi:hypothetical protein
MQELQVLPQQLLVPSPVAWAAAAQPGAEVVVELRALWAEAARRVPRAAVVV